MVMGSMVEVVNDKVTTIQLSIETEMENDRERCLVLS